jgi:hypothetical protein
MVIIILRYGPSIRNSFRFFFNHEEILNFIKGFCIHINMIMWFLFLLLFICNITFIDLWMLDHPFIPGIKPTWSQCVIFLMCCWIWVVSTLLRNFASMFQTWFYNFLFCCSVLIQFWYHKMSFVTFLSFLFYGLVWGTLVLVVSKGQVEFSSEFFLCWETLYYFLWLI